MWRSSAAGALKASNSRLFGPVAAAGRAEGRRVVLVSAFKHTGYWFASNKSIRWSIEINSYQSSLVLIQQTDDDQKHPHPGWSCDQLADPGSEGGPWWVSSGSDLLLCLTGSWLSSCDPLSPPPSHWWTTHQPKRHKQQQDELQAGSGFWFWSALGGSSSESECQSGFMVLHVCGVNSAAAGRRPQAGLRLIAERKQCRTPNSWFCLDGIQLHQDPDGSVSHLHLLPSPLELSFFSLIQEFNVETVHRFVSIRVNKTAPLAFITFRLKFPS